MTDDAQKEINRSLWEAAKNGWYDNVCAALDAGADVDSADCDSTALDYALWRKHYDVARVLLERGANPNRQHSITNYTTFSANVWAEDVKAVELLLDFGAHINALDNHGKGTTALVKAAIKDDHVMIALLLERGANPLVRDGYGRLPSDVAASHANYETLRAAERRAEAKQALPRFKAGPKR